MKKLSDQYDYSVLLIKKERKDKPERLFMFDKLHFMNGKGKGEEEAAIGYHMNFDEVFSDSVRKKFYHKKISEETYLRLKDLGETAKKVRVAGKVLLVADIALDVIELCKITDADLKDSDKKLGRKTASNIAEIGGNWGGSIAGAEIGAYAGALTGPFAPITVPILSFVGGIAGSYGGEELAKYIIDITYVGE